MTDCPVPNCPMPEPPRPPNPNCWVGKSLLLYIPAGQHVHCPCGCGAVIHGSGTIC